MTHLDLAFKDFIDALETAMMRLVSKVPLIILPGGWVTDGLLVSGFPALTVLSSYPTSWAQPYIEQRYEDFDPVVGLARSSQRLIQWDRRTLRLPSASQQRFEAAKFGIQSGATVPIRRGFVRFAAFMKHSDPMILWSWVALSPSQP
ncbi:hypothetical protein EH240_36120 [Mesorhizobium tamadayense]|uniref:Transcription factor LuxR-like autoinducer-binding domain-containing protein n=1 Tax=Mesorhizobium tamadayense TaxID=425306 RepID=A0A3P3EMV3_9HYPH|nr:autoinducer binding domain-containing protein [Mesorhizobium tamadayense]RRH87720.1 hypothetical protein EH240_36120 [Mesorhizobium tamadayense]